MEQTTGTRTESELRKYSQYKGHDIFVSSYRIYLLYENTEAILREVDVLPGIIIGEENVNNI